MSSLPHAALSPPGLLATPRQVLVVDDEPDVREVVVELLAAMGFAPSTAGDGEEGLALMRDDPDRYCLLVLDIRMPRLGGREVLDALRSLGVRLPVLLVSAHAEAEGEAATAAHPAVRFLRKPFRLAALEEAVHALVDSGDPTPSTR